MTLVRCPYASTDSAVANIAGTAAFEIVHPTATSGPSADDAFTAAKKSSTGQSYLVAGAEGRIFAVRILADNSVPALKVVPASSSATTSCLKASQTAIGSSRVWCTSCCGDRKLTQVLL